MKSERREQKKEALKSKGKKHNYSRWHDLWYKLAKPSTPSQPKQKKGAD